MTNSLNLEDIEAASRRLLDDRMDSVRALATARADVAAKQEALLLAQAADKTAYDATLRAGWSPEEIRKVGLGPTATKRSRATSPRRTKAAPGNTGLADTTPAVDHQG